MREIINNRIEEINGEKFTILYNKDTGEYVRLNQDALKIYTIIKSDNALESLKGFKDEDNINNLLDVFRKRNILVPEYHENVTTDKKIPRGKVENGILIHHLRLDLTENCNLDCTYCYEKVTMNSIKENMSWEIAKKAIDEFYIILVNNNTKNCSVRFFGGEPLLQLDLLIQCLDYCNNLFTKRDIVVEYLLNTNGTLLTREICELLKKYNVHVILSLDGIGSVNDEHRKFKNGVGSFDIINTKVDYLYQERCSFTYTVVCTDQNYKDLKNLIDYIADKGKLYGIESYISINTLRICSRKGIVDISVEEQVNYIMEAIKYAETSGVRISSGSIHMCFRHFIDKNINNRYCAGIGSELCIHPNGDICACTGNQTKIGDIFNIDHLLKSKKYLDIAMRDYRENSECVACEIKTYCSGGCYAEYLSSDGKESNTNRGCELEIKLFKELIKHYLLS